MNEIFHLPNINTQQSGSKETKGSFHFRANSVLGQSGLKSLRVDTDAFSPVKQTGNLTRNNSIA